MGAGKRVVLLLGLLACGGCGKGSTTHWIEQLKAPESIARIQAIHTLQERKGDAEIIVPALSEALQDENIYVRRDAARRLGSFGAEAKSATPALQAALRDREASVRTAAAKALAHRPETRRPRETRKITSHSTRRRSFVRCSRNILRRTEFPSMRAFTRPGFWRDLRHRLCAASVCFAYLIAALGIPLPASVHKDASQPFPCQDHPCGCQTAEQCWRNCCCFTPEERWAWARTHHVEPPSYAEKPAAQGWNTVKLRNRGKAETTRAAKPCCSNHEPRPACCQPRSDRAAKPTPPERGRVRWGTAMAAWRCQGLPLVWVGSGAVLPVPPPVTWSPDPSVASPIPRVQVIASAVPLSPPAPPPRRCTQSS